MNSSTTRRTFSSSIKSVTALIRRVGEEGVANTRPSCPTWPGLTTNALLSVTRKNMTVMYILRGGCFWMKKQFLQRLCRRESRKWTMRFIFDSLTFWQSYEDLTRKSSARPSRANKCCVFVLRVPCHGRHRGKNRQTVRLRVRTNRKKLFRIPDAFGLSKWASSANLTRLSVAPATYLYFWKKKKKGLSACHWVSPMTTQLEWHMVVANAYKCGDLNFGSLLWE